MLRDFRCSAYADDLKIYKSLRSSNEDNDLQAALETVKIWCTGNGVTLNLSKRCVISFTRRLTRMNIDYRVNNTPIARVGKILTSSSL